MILCFFSCTQESDFDIVEDRGQIACNYIQGWFLVDLFAILPFELMLSGDGVSGSSMVRVIRLGKLGKLIRITKMFKVLKII